MCCFRCRVKTIDDGELTKQIYMDKQAPLQWVFWKLLKDNLVANLSTLTVDNVNDARELIASGYTEPDDEWSQACDTTSITIDGGDGQDMTVYIIKSKANKDRTDLTGFIFAHGGGGMLGTAEEANGENYRFAVENDLVIFNIDYRLAPEHRVPAASEDMIAAIKYFHTNAADYGMDPDKLTVGGSSGGGYTTIIAMILLGREGLGSLVNT
jgi:acetyl esterase